MFNKPQPPREDPGQILDELQKHQLQVLDDQNPPQ